MKQSFGHKWYLLGMGTGEKMGGIPFND